MGRERDERITRRAREMMSHGHSVAVAYSLARIEEIDRMESDLARLRRAVEAASYMDAAFDVMVSVRQEPKRLEHARDIFTEKRREFRAALADVDAGGER